MAILGDLRDLSHEVQRHSFGKRIHTSLDVDMSMQNILHMVCPL
jgi:hypothetical protein